MTVTPFGVITQCDAEKHPGCWHEGHVFVAGEGRIHVRWHADHAFGPHREGEIV